MVARVGERRGAGWHMIEDSFMGDEIMMTGQLEYTTCTWGEDLVREGGIHQPAADPETDPSAGCKIISR